MRLYLVGFQRVFAGSIAACTALLSGCGIYTVGKALNPPSGISMSTIELKFTGDNKADFTTALFDDTGYMLWFKEKEDDPYRVVQYNGTIARPTIPITGIPIPPSTLPPGVTDDGGDPIVGYIVQIAYMEHPDYDKDFLELKDEGSTFFFAVSATGSGGLESEKAEFGQWPP